MEDIYTNTSYVTVSITTRHDGSPRQEVATIYVGDGKTVKQKKALLWKRVEKYIATMKNKKREILFKGVMSHDYQQWVCGSLLIEDGRPARIIEKDGNWASVDPNTIGQYIEIRDFKGAMIFEGDELEGVNNEGTHEECRTNIGYPEFRNGKLLLVSVRHNGDEFCRDFFQETKCWDRIYVAGNIHDNPQD